MSEPLVGLVLVSHSRVLAEGTADLAREIGVGRVTVVPAGGDVDGGLGTSFEFVERAVETADRGAGAVLIADIGSSVLTARTYIAETDRTVRFADAPLVEGAVAAAAAAAAGAGLEAVAAAATEAYGHQKT